MSLCAITLIFSYTKIFLTLRQHQTQVQDHVQRQGQRNPLNIARYRKAVSSALRLQLTLVACYLPYGVMSSILTNTELFSFVPLSGQYTTTLSILELIAKPDSLLLENRRRKTSTEGRN